MKKVIKSIEDVRPWSFLSDDQLHALVRELFKRLDMVRAFDQDYEVAVEFPRTDRQEGPLPVLRGSPRRAFRGGGHRTAR